MSIVVLPMVKDGPGSFSSCRRRTKRVYEKDRWGGMDSENLKKLEDRRSTSGRRQDLVSMMSLMLASSMAGQKSL
ncbi:MAG: transposase family protein [Puniceicoccales bacterium]|nr:transposase family protein [Puniceicoccales bacterium]